MADGNKSFHVTRQEFYSALSLIWLYIMLVIGDLMRLEERWTTMLLFAASVLMVIVYTAMCFMAMRTRTAVSDMIPLSDRVKEIARDPNRKIEAIQAYREETGAGLAEAKDAVEAYIDSL